MSIVTVRLAALSGAIAVMLGAFGAHSLKSILSANQLSSWKTAVLYMLVHSIVLLVLGLQQNNKSSAVLRQSTWLIFAGIICFSGSIILLVLQDYLGMNMGWLGPVTPLGGLLFIAGWLNLLRVTKA